MKQEYTKAVQQYRVDIRRKHLDIHFTEHRNRFRQEQQLKRIQQLRTNLSTAEKKLELAHQYSIKMQGEVGPQWVQLLTDLYYLCKVYQNQHEIWVNTGLLKAIASTFKLFIQSYLHPDAKELTILSSNILTDIFVMNSCEHPIVIKSLLSYEFIDYFILTLKSTQEIQYIRLLARILISVPQLRQYIYKMDCLDLIITKIQSLSKEGEEAQICYYAIYGFIKIHEIDQNTSLNPKKVCVSKIIQYLFIKFDQNHSNNITDIILKTLYELARLNKQEVFQKLCSARNVIQKAIKIMCQNGSQNVRLSAGKYLSQILCSRDSVHIQNVFDCGIVGKLYDDYQRNPNDSNLLIYLSILTNLTADSVVFQNIIICHPIFQEMILSQAINSPNPYIRKQALYCLNNFAYDKTANHIEMLITKYKILQIMIENVRMPDTHPDTIRDILKIWQSMIEDCALTQQVHDNIAYIALVKYYHVSELLLELEGDIQTQAEKFVDFINNYTYSV